MMSSMRLRNSGAEVLLELVVNLVLHPLVVRLVAGARREAEADGLRDVGRAQVRGEDQHRVLEVDGATLTVGETTVLEDLQERVVDLLVGLLDLVEQDDGERLAAHLLGELAAFLVTDVPGRRTEQTRRGEPIVELAHVDLDERVVLAEQEVRQRLDSSVLPTPDGPAKMNEPDGRFGSFRPARVRRIALATALTASSWPMIRLCSSSSMRSRRVVSSSVSLNTGIPVQFARTSAICSSSTSAMTSRSPARHCFSRSARWATSCFSLSRRLAAFSKSCASIADSFSRRASAIRSSNSRRSGGAVIRRIRIRAPPASSMRSMALSGRKRSLMYRSARVAAATSALSVIETR